MATTTTIRDLSGLPLGVPIGRLEIRTFPRAISPGSIPLGSYFEFNFNPLFDLSSPARALSFFSNRLRDVDSRVGRETVRRIATFAFEQVHSRNWICGLFLWVVLETVPIGSQIRADFVDGHVILNGSSVVVLEDYVSNTMIHRNEYENGMSELEILSLCTEEVTGDDEEGECCAICLEGFVRGTMVIPLVPCSHRFHNGCIIPWLRNKRTCPICRGRCTVKFS